MGAVYVRRFAYVLIDNTTAAVCSLPCAPSAQGVCLAEQHKAALCSQCTGSCVWALVAQAVQALSFRAMCALHRALGLDAGCAAT